MPLSNPKNTQLIKTDHLFAYQSGQGQATLLFHGGMGSHTHWVRNIPVLSETMSVYALDLPGLGNSPNVVDDIDASSYLDNVFTAIQSVIPSNESVDIIAFSFGSVVASHIAAQLGNRLRKMSLIGPGGFGIPKGRNMDIRKRNKTTNCDLDEKAVIRHNLLQGMIFNPDAIDDETIQIQLNNVNRTRFNSRVVSFSVSILENLAKTSCPLQIIWGEEDKYAFPSVQNRVERCEAVRGFSKHIIPNCGHWAQYESPNVINQLLTTFHSTA